MQDILRKYLAMISNLNLFLSKRLTLSQTDIHVLTLMRYQTILYMVMMRP